jgi:hypothetical protein
MKRRKETQESNDEMDSSLFVRSNLNRWSPSKATKRTFVKTQLLVFLSCLAVGSQLFSYFDLKILGRNIRVSTQQPDADTDPVVPPPQQQQQQQQLDPDMPRPQPQPRPRRQSKPNPVIRLRGDPLMVRRNTWDVSPIVIEKHKLLFFSVPKVAATTFKQLFRRMMGHENWKSVTLGGLLPHDPGSNGLKYLWHYNLTQAEHFITSPEWTRVVFVRDPKTKLVSAYKDKALLQNGGYMRKQFCGITAATPMGTKLAPKQCPGLRPLESRKCQELAPFNKTMTPEVFPFQKFVKDFLRCPDPHWRPQAKRVARTVWKQINFVGRFEHLYEDSKRLLEQIGAWDDYGASGWEEGAIFESNTAAHQTSSSASTNHISSSGSGSSQLYTPEVLEIFYDKFRKDYEHPVLNFTKPPDFPERKE